MAMDELKQSKKKWDEINKGDGGKVVPKKKKRKKKNRKSFEEKHKRMTTYVQKPLYRKIQRLKEIGEIRTITEFVNRAFQEYLEQNF